MVKLLHLSDVHLGAKFQMLGERGREQRRQVRDTFARAMELAANEGVDLVLIAGDLFDSPHQPDSTVFFVTEQFRRLEAKGIPVCLIAGNHDPLEAGGVYTMAQFDRQCSNVTVFDSTPSAKIFPHLSLTVFGSSPPPGAGRSMLSGWQVERQTRFAVGLAHGGVYRPGQVEDRGAIHPDEIRTLGLDYFALGDWHSCQQVLGPPTTAWYSGAPEFLGFDQEGAGHVLLVTLDAPGSARVQPIRLGRRTYRRVEVDVSSLDPSGSSPSGRTLEELKGRLRTEADPDLILEVVLKGLVRPGETLDGKELEEDLGGFFFHLRVRNQSHLRLEDLDEESFPAATVLGKFVRLMRRKAEEADPQDQPLIEEALQLGVALLQGKEVL